jgi:hypothetical protein
MDKSRSGRNGRPHLFPSTIHAPSHWLRALLFALGIGGISGIACALDLPTLDKVAVMMSLDEVRKIAGAPDETTRVEPEFTLATWTMTDAPGMAAAGGIFDARNVLIAQVYVFAGETGAQALASLREFGFKVVENPDGTVRLYGRDDDTGRPLVVVIDQQPETTTVYAYEQGEYEKRVAQGSPPPGARALTAAAAPPSANSGIDPNVRAAIAAGVALLGGPMGPGTKPDQWKKTTTLSSHSSTTRNPDGSITTRSSKTTMTVGVDPVGVANALLILMK